MRYRVWDEEDKKEQILEDCVTDLGEVGSVRRVNIKQGGKYIPHHFKILEVLPERS
jgi:hypothetical protein